MQSLKIICAIAASALFALSTNVSFACGDGKMKDCHCSHKCHCGKTAQNCKCAKGHHMSKKNDSDHKDHKVG